MAERECKTMSTRGASFHRSRGAYDDAVMAFEEFLDAKRVLGDLGKRFARYGLSLHPDKTRFVGCGSPDRPIATPSRAKLFHEEPDAGILYIRICEG